MRVDVQIFGDTQLSRDIERVGHRGGNLQPVWRSIFDRLTEIEGEQFHTQGARGGTPWEPLKPATIRSKQQRGYSDPALAEFATHDLYEALSSSEGVSPNQERIFNDEWAVFRVTGDPGEYGPIQHGGAEANNLPARPLFVLTNADRAEFMKRIQLFVMTGELGDWF